jgi:hypothetical protein
MGTHISSIASVPENAWTPPISPAAKNPKTTQPIFRFVIAPPEWLKTIVKNRLTRRRFESGF